MKKVTLSVATMAVLSSSAFAVDNLADAFKEGTTSGQIRTFYIDRDRSGTIGDTQTDRNALATGGHLKFETAAINGFNVGTAFYTTNGIFGINKAGDDKRNATLFGEGKAGYSILGEAYLQYKANKTAVKIGRQKLNTPLAGADDARMLPNLFEAGVLTNSDLENTTLLAGHITKFQAGTFSNAYGSNALSIHSGYGLNNISGKFLDAGQYAVGQNTSGVSVLSATYTGVKGLKLQAWDYLAHDILNAIYLQGDYGWNCLLNDGVKMKASAQYITQSENGDKYAGNVDSQYLGAKLAATAGAFTGSVAYSTTGDSDGAYNGGIITPWGGMPAFTQGMVTRHMFFADTDAMKIAGTYNFKNTGVDVKATAYHASFDVGKKAAVGTTVNDVVNAQGFTAKESGFDIQYNPAGIKNLNLRLRANYPTEFVPGLDWSEYRVIANYNF